MGENERQQTIVLKECQKFNNKYYVYMDFEKLKTEWHYQ